MNLSMKPLRLLVPRWIAALAACVFCCASPVNGLAQEPGKTAAPTPEQEAKFIATLTEGLPVRIGAAQDIEFITLPAGRGQYRVFSFAHLLIVACAGGTKARGRNTI